MNLHRKRLPIRPWSGWGGLLWLTCGCHPHKDPGGPDTGADAGTAPLECAAPKTGPRVAAASGCRMDATTPSWTLVSTFDDISENVSVSGAVFAHREDTSGDGKADDDDETDLINSTELVSGGVLSGVAEVLAYRGDGTLLWTADINAYDLPPSTPAVGDLDGDGTPDVFLIAGAWEDARAIALDGETGTQLWNTPLTVPSQFDPLGCGVSLADLDGDGFAEAVIGPIVLDGATGHVLGEGKDSWGTAYSWSSVDEDAPYSVIADLDLDGEQEVITGDAAYNKDGSVLWENSGVGHPIGDGYVAIGNFDSDPYGEVFVAHYGSVMDLLQSNGDLLWTQFQGGGGSMPGPPAVADFNGDGRPEIAVPTSTGLYMLDGDGTLLWSKPIGAGSTTWDGVSGYDLDGDGRWEVLDVGPAGLTILNGKNGKVLATYPEANGTSWVGAAATVGDFDGDGSVDIAYGVAEEASEPRAYGIRVVSDSAGGFVPGNGTWNELSYSITNIDPDGHVPAKPVQNFTTNNSFRAGPPRQYRDFVAELDSACVADCTDPTSPLVLTWALGNDTPWDEHGAVPVEFWARTSGADVLLGRATWSEPIPATTMAASVEEDFASWPTPLLGIYVKIDPDNAIAECDETDSQASWDTPGCP